MNGLAPISNPKPWVMSMRWEDLAFLHWPVPIAALEPHIPQGLRLDTFAGHAWVGVVPFRMAGVRARGLPEVPGTNDFLELNLRTYVTDGSRPGVWFFSLDCENLLAVRGARVGFSLPYFDAHIKSLESDLPAIDLAESDNPSFEYSSRRTHRGSPDATFRATYSPRISRPLGRCAYRQ